MLMYECNIFKEPCDALCITTNGYVKKNGQAVLGRGVAHQASQLLPDLPVVLGSQLKHGGNHIHLLNGQSPIWLSFPVKPHHVINDGTNVVGHMKYAMGAFVPGCFAKAELPIIEASCHELVAIANTHGFEKVLIPKPGCGAGELKWEDVRPVIEPLLDDRFWICDLPRKKND